MHVIVYNTKYSTLLYNIHPSPRNFTFFCKYVNFALDVKYKKCLPGPKFRHFQKYNFIAFVPLHPHTSTRLCTLHTTLLHTSHAPPYIAPPQHTHTYLYTTQAHRYASTHQPRTPSSRLYTPLDNSTALFIPLGVPFPVSYLRQYVTSTVGAKAHKMSVSGCSKVGEKVSFVRCTNIG